MITEGKEINMIVKVPRCLKCRCAVITPVVIEGIEIDILMREIKQGVSIAANLTMFKEIVDLTTNSYVEIVDV